MSALITLSKQISDGKLASNRPHLMDLCAQFIKKLIKPINHPNVTHTPDMGLFSCDLMKYQYTSAVETLIKNAHDDKATEPLLMQYFKALDSPAVDAFIKHPICQSDILEPFNESHKMMVLNGSIPPLQRVIEVLFLILVPLSSKTKKQ
jgi:hypothetical protein